MSRATHHERLEEARAALRDAEARVRLRRKASQTAPEPLPPPPAPIPYPEPAQSATSPHRAPTWPPYILDEQGCDDE